MKFFVPIVLLLFTSCTPLQEPKLEESADQKVAILQDLLNQGWELHVVEDKLILIKHDEHELLIYDLFGVMNED